MISQARRTSAGRWQATSRLQVATVEGTHEVDSPALARAVTDSAKTVGRATLMERDFAMFARISVSGDLLKEAGTLIHLINSGSARLRR